MSSVKEIDEQLAELERSPRKPEEEEYIQACAEAVTPEQREKLIELDYLTAVRGYASYNPRKEETVKAFKGIVEWRDKVQYYEYLRNRLERDEDFYNYWPEFIYGNDKYGHPLVCMHVERINIEALSEMDVDHMLRLQGQKQCLYSAYKREVSAEVGVQRHKYSLIVDLKNSGFGILFGKKKSIIQQIFKVGSDYFPESIWKIYVINAPFIFRTAWAAVKPWIHPITQAKVNMLGSADAAVKRMHEDGYSDEAIPDFLGGKCTSTPTFRKLMATIEKNNAASAEAEAQSALSAAAAVATEQAAVSMGHLAVV